MPFIIYTYHWPFARIVYFLHHIAVSKQVLKKNLLIDVLKISNASLSNSWQIKIKLLYSFSTVIFLKKLKLLFITFTDTSKMCVFWEGFCVCVYIQNTQIIIDNLFKYVLNNIPVSYSCIVYASVYTCFHTDRQQFII